MVIMSKTPAVTVQMRQPWEQQWCSPVVISTMICQPVLVPKKKMQNPHIPYEYKTVSPKDTISPYSGSKNQFVSIKLMAFEMQQHTVAQQWMAGLGLILALCFYNVKIEIKGKDCQ